MNSIQWLREIPKNNKSRTFITSDSTGKKLTFGELDQFARSIANQLQFNGLKKNDRICVCLPNSLECVKFYFACLYAGITVIPIPLTSTPKEIQQILFKSNSKAIIIDDSLHSSSLKIIKQSKLQILTFSDKLQNSKGINFIENTITDNNFIPFQKVSVKDPIVIIFTSGTTSEPKAVVHSIQNLVDNARTFGKINHISKKNIFFNLLSLMYLGGYYNLLFLPYVCQSSVVLSSNFEPQSIINFWKPIIKNKINTLWLVPSIISILLRMDRDSKGRNYCKKNILLAFCGTAPLLPSVKHEFEAKYGLNILENYGLTETFFISCQTKKTDLGVGKLLPKIEIKIVDQNGSKVSNGNEGEICIKSPFQMQGYFDYNAKKLISLKKSSWFNTGDIGKFSKNNLFITGRKKDLIIRGGINISPSSIESIINKHPKVLESCVVGIQNEILGEEIIAVVQLSPNTKLNNIESKLKNLCSSNLSSIKQPSKFIQLPALPRSTYGKIQKNKVKVWLKSHLDKQNNITPSQKNHNLKLKQKSAFLPSKSVLRSNQAISIKYNNLVYEKQAAGEDVIVLSLGEAFFDIPLFSFDDLPKSKIYHYSHSRGLPGLRKKICKYFLENYDVTIDDSTEMIITAGSKIGIQMSLMTCINPGDEVIIHEPAWVSFPEQVKICHGIPVQVPYNESIFDFEKYISKKSKLIIINSPHNPSGKIYSLEELSFLYSLAKKYNLMILSDEAYSDFLPENDEFVSLANLDTKKQNSIVVNSISKNFGISGWRIGYVVGNEKFINQLLKLNQHLITCPPTILEYYLENHFDDIISITKPQIKKLLEKRKDIAKYMEKLSLKFLEGRATFYFFVSISDSKLGSIDFCDKLLNDHHVSTVPGIGYGDSCDKFIRISIGSEPIERIKHALKLIRKLILLTSK